MEMDGRPANRDRGYEGGEVVDEIPGGQGEDAGLEPLVVQQELCEGLVGKPTTPGQDVRQLREFADVVLPQALVQEQWLGVDCIECLQGI